MKKLDPLKLWTTITAAGGAALMGYLTRLHYSDSGSAVCDIAEGFSCDIVNKSLYSEIVGVPVAVLGLVYFLAVPYLLYAKPFKQVWRIILLFTVFSLVFGLYLTSIEHFIIDSICLFCELSKALMLVIGGLAIYGIKQNDEELPSSWIVGVILLALLFSWAAYGLQRPTEPPKDYAPLAQCLTENDVAMYGAYWCPSCAKQKRDFGNAFTHIEYVECDARGENAEPERCIERDIRKTPTWIQERNGEIIESVEGVRSPEELAETFGCEESL